MEQEQEIKGKDKRQEMMRHEMGEEDRRIGKERRAKERKGSI